MIRNQWYVILNSNQVKQGKPVGVTRMGEKLVLWRDKSGKVACIQDRCPHLGASLCGGSLSGEENVLCPFHGFEFDPSGQCVYIPAMGRAGTPPKAMRVAGYPTYEAHNWIWIYWGEPQGELKPPRYFDVDGMTYGAYHQVWPVHYSRMVENQLDLMHLPFVHHNTIGRGNRVVVDGPIVKLEDGILRAWVNNRLDDGTPPRKPEDLPEPTRPAMITFIFPNLWQLYLGEKMREVVAFVPVDEEHGMFYVRQYQGFVKAPILRDLVNLIGLAFAKRIADQDKVVVSTQIPKKASLRNGDKFVQGDRVLLTYRRYREELIEAGLKQE